MKGDNRRTIDKRILYVVLSAVITLLDYMICRKHSFMVFLTTDDSSIQNTLSGFSLGVPCPVHQFISIFIGYPMTFLYKMIPGVQWWYVYSLALMLIGIFLVNYAFVRVGAGTNGGDQSYLIRNLILYSSIIYFNIGFAVPALARTAFTIVPALYGTGLLAVIFLLGLRDRISAPSLVVCFILFLPALFHRNQSAYVLLCYLLMVLLWLLIRSIGIWGAVRRFALYAIAIIATVAVFVGTDRMYQNRLQGEEFLAFNNGRVEIIDRAVDSYDENPDMYKSVGWTRDTYIMAKQMCFVDSRITADSLRYIAQNSDPDKIEFDNENGFFGDMCNRALVVGFVAYTLFTVIVMAFIRDRFTSLFVAIDLAGTTVLIGYQFLTNRVIYRSLVVCMLPAFVAMSLIVLSSKEPATCRGRFVNWTASVLACLLVITALVNGQFLSECMYVDLREDQGDAYVDSGDEIYEYITARKDNIYVYPGYDESIIPDKVYSKDISNSLSWGGVDWLSYANRIQLAKNGLDRLDDETFLRDNVYLISNETTGVRRRCLNSFFNWMSSVHPEYDVIRVDMIDANRNVYQFVKKEERR